MRLSVEIFEGKTLKFKIQRNPAHLWIKIETKVDIDKCHRFKEKIMPNGNLTISSDGVYENGFKWNESLSFFQNSPNWYLKETEVVNQRNEDVALENLVNQNEAKKLNFKDETYWLKYFQLYILKFNNQKEIAEIWTDTVDGEINPKYWKRIHEDAIKSDPFYSHPFPDPNDPRI